MIMNPQSPNPPETARRRTAKLSRRRFLGSAVVAGAAAPSLDLLRGVAAEPAISEPPQPAEVSRKIKLGVVGTGQRGAWIANLFKRHGGYDIWAVADYFQSVADACGDALGVHASRRFSTLSGYKQLMDSGVEAVALETPPFFFPGHVHAAVEAGLHIYMAKPVAVDVPGCLEVETLAKRAAAAERCFLVDYQIPTDPHNCEVMKRIKAGAIGPVAVVNSHYLAPLFPDPAFTANWESRLQRLVWCNDNAVGGGYHVNACIHGVDAALWVAGARPVAAMGISRRMRENPHGDSHDVFSILLEFRDGQVISHRGKHLNNLCDFDVICQVQGQTGYAQTCYGGRTFLKGHDEAYAGQVENLYEAGAVRNIATFYRDIISGNCENPTVSRAVDGALTTILGREAAALHARLTLAELLKENKRLEVDLRGLKS
jgi:myo-inositol 2-dehydrogenase / D-chiro-inositol 1-dehydrogenase